ncbi:MAG TPA: DUF6712 family protein [Spirochaetota bacterium]|nr:DUF6712 family protein [Spirochaetota bacterium]
MIIKSADKIREYNKAFKSLLDDQVLPFVHDAEEKYIKPYLGKTQYAELSNYVESGSSDDSELNALLPYVERAASRFVLLMASPSMDINLGSTGYTTASTQGSVPASQQRVQKYDQNLEKLGYENIETMLEFLEESRDDYPLWVNSDAYTFLTQNFLRTAKEFNELVSIEVNRLMFRKMKPTIRDVELRYIDSRISEDLADEILTQINNSNVTSENQKLLNHIRPAVAKMTVASIKIEEFERGDTSFIIESKALKREEYQDDAWFHLMEIQQILDNNIDDYPLYTNSDLYDSEKETDDLYESEEDDPVQSMGAIPK